MFKQILVGFFAFFFVNVAHSEIYDCFIFFNELELLKVRFEELYDHVDKFVIVESLETFRANSKPLYFNENKHLFQKYSDKIIHVITEKTSYPLSATWDREAFQREQIIRGLVSCKPEDVIMISDLDEIPRGDDLKRIIQPVIEKTCHRVVCAHTNYAFFLNIKAKELRHGTVIATYDVFKNLYGFNSTKLRTFNSNFQIADNGGWHFSSFGGLKKFFYKIESYSHFEIDTPDFKRPETVLKFIKDFCVEVPIDGTYPKFIQDNLNYFDEIGFVYHGQIQ